MECSTWSSIVTTCANDCNRDRLSNRIAPGGLSRRLFRTIALEGRAERFASLFISACQETGRCPTMPVPTIRPFRRSSIGYGACRPCGCPGSGADHHPARTARQSAASPAAGVPCRGHERQGFDLRLSARGDRSVGQSVHVYSSPHLVRFNERIRLNGRLIEDDALAAVLDEVLGHAEGIGTSFFEVTTAAAFLSFARNPAAAAIIEVGLGGRLDATNILPPPAVCGIAALGIDHEAFLGRKLTGIAREKAGIAKRGTPLVTMDYARPLRDAIAEVAAAAGAPVFARGQAWSSASTRSAISYRDEHGQLTLPRPSLPGGHQSRNLALAIAMLRHQQAIDVTQEALEQAATGARWPARMQRLAGGRSRRSCPPRRSAGSTVPTTPPPQRPWLGPWRGGALQGRPRLCWECWRTRKLSRFWRSWVPWST